MTVILSLVSLSFDSEQKNIIIRAKGTVKIAELSVLVMVALNLGVSLGVFNG
jgi:hypothetical protein